MQPDPLTIAPELPLAEVLHLFVVAHIGGAPVVDGAGRVRGMISRADLLRVLDQAGDEDLDPGEAAPGDLAAPAAAAAAAAAAPAAAVDDDADADADDATALAVRLDTLTAGQIATPGAIWVAPDLPVAEVAQRMRREGIHRVLVGDGARLAGIVTAFDLLRALEPAATAPDEGPPTAAERTP